LFILESHKAFTIMKNKKILKIVLPILGGFSGVILGAIGGWNVAPDIGVTQEIFAIVGIGFGLTLGLILGTAIYKAINKKYS